MKKNISEVEIRKEESAVKDWKKAAKTEQENIIYEICDAFTNKARNKRSNRGKAGVPDGDF